MTVVEQLGQRLEGSLAHALRHAGWSVRAEAEDADANFIVSDGKHVFLVELRVASSSTRPLTEAMLSNAVLRATSAAKARGARPLAVVGAERISERTAGALRSFARQHIAPGIAYGWIDSAGTLELHGPAPLERVRAPQARASEPSTLATRGHSVFSDLGQWLLKVLLAPRLPPTLLNAPRVAPRNARHLAHLAEVSEPTAHRIVSAAREQGLIHEGKGRVTVVDPAALLQRWRLEAAEMPHDLRTKWILRTSDSSTALIRALATKGSNEPPVACLGLFAAARHLGLGFVQGVAPHLLLASPSTTVLEELGLRLAEPGEHADVLVRRPSAPQSTFRGAVQHKGVWTSDVLQIWLDVADHPARGEEQAAHIHRRVLSSAFTSEEP